MKMTEEMRKIKLRFHAHEQSEGVGARVRRSIGSPHISYLDPFLLLDDGTGSLPGGFPDHPHRGFETVSYILPNSEGGFQHEDFLGNKGDLRPGDLQWMTAGRGIVHSEMPASLTPARVIQLWINLPRAKKMREPHYQEVKRENVPQVYTCDKNVKALLFAGSFLGEEGPIKTEAPVSFIHFIMEKHAKLTHFISNGHNAFFYVISGDGIYNGERIAAYDTIVLESIGSACIVETRENSLELVILTGEPLHEPVARYGPFVMSTEEEIQQAIKDFRNGENGFENAKSWKSKIGNR
ncbi:unnamed protein product [Albugo candida]|uniref:Pirin N-terminal domain-containing protein n=1 Tax=Albugo candida TaxID=65357 RepID=A0A024GEG6_9STRA|nr:unnamed protein product [Albugo candida]|eukprot:CCI45269.1 unnamed protein product [Albugo candida]